MANKLFLVCATLALFFLLTNASIYRTIVEFDEESDDSTNPMAPMQKCQKEFQQEQHLIACQRFMLKQLRRGRGGSPSLDDDELDFEEEDDIENPQRPQLLQMCCSELRKEDTECVCPTLRQAARAVKLQGKHGPMQTRKLYKTAKHLPNICKIPQVGVCPFQAVPYLPSYY